jgi:hypothetical protein
MTDGRHKVRGLVMEEFPGRELAARLPAEGLARA